jgi:hypothetical protein
MDRSVNIFKKNILFIANAEVFLIHYRAWLENGLASPQSAPGRLF